MCPADANSRVKNVFVLRHIITLEEIRVRVRVRVRVGVRGKVR